MATTSNIRLTGVVLAGGQSRRMGRDKAGIEFEGQPMWLRQISLLRSIGLDECVISGRSDGPYAAAEIRVIEDAHGNCGPLGGILTALEYLDTDGILALAIDMPGVPVSLLQGLRDKARETGLSVIPRSAKGYEPLVAVYLKTAIATAAKRIRSGDFRLQHFVDELIAQELAVSFPVSEEQAAWFANWNAPDDLFS